MYQGIVESLLPTVFAKVSDVCLYMWMAESKRSNMKTYSSAKVDHGVDRYDHDLSNSFHVDVDFAFRGR
jgi:hypothetical protein